MNIDTETGLPELPEGYFWSIYAESFSDYLTIELRKVRPRIKWLSRRADWTVVRKNEANSTLIRRRAEYVFSDYFKPKPDPNSWKRYLGNYPPKKLEVES